MTEFEFQIDNFMFQLKGRVLDIGTATGRYPIYFAQKGCNVTGIDISDDALHIAQRNLMQNGLEDKVHLLKMNALSLNFPEHSFDIITCMMGTFSHFSNEEKNNLLFQIWQVLRPNGIVIISSWDSDYPFTNFLSFYNETERKLLKQNSLPSQHLLKMMGKWFSNIQQRAVCSFSDEQLEQLLMDDKLELLRELHQFMQVRFPEIQGQLHITFGKKI
ncbi:class I SAM-dependent methyltransferase [Salinithrix halophila]|uniref:Class I SAM-dependent methyltransferase n=1 Tax=Salinithrix halophila TaxID=1485204 RepID=A0ABV8JLY4_9BACL